MLPSLSLSSQVLRKNYLHILSFHCISYTAPLFEKNDVNNDFNRSVENNIVHITSINTQTNERSIVQLELSSASKSWKSRREFALPSLAIDGLRNALLSCERSPKQLQHEADQLTHRLNQRRFPASSSVIRDARNKIKKMLSKKYGEWEENGSTSDEKTKEVREYQMRNEVDMYLKKSHYNWKPLNIDSREAAATYTLSQIAPHFAELSRILEEFNNSSFIPKSVLDYGSGSGAGFWAINEKFGDVVKEYCMVDTSDFMTQFSMDVMRGNGDRISNPLVHKNISFRRHLVPSLQSTYDLVIVHRTLCEIGSRESRLELLTSLWKRTNKFLIIAESGLRDAFESLLEARDYILTSGTHLHLNETAQLLKDYGSYSAELDSILNDRNLSDYERFTLIREAIPADVSLPTALPTATVFAPCPHDLGCPLLKEKVCSFPIRWRPIRADGKKTKDADGTETRNVSYIILEKSARQPSEPLSRILKMRKLKGHVTCDVCTAFKGIQRMTVSRRAGDLYQKVRVKRDGELFPLISTTRVTENMFDLFKDTDK